MKYTKAQLALGSTRIIFSFIFLWAFFDKLFGLGFATTPEKSWLAGGSPTLGFLSNNKGPFDTFFHALAGNAVTDWLFMLGLLGIGLALFLGIGIKIAAYSGALLMFLMWLASFPLKSNPVIDDHIIYILLFCLFHCYDAGKYVGLGNWWAKTNLVRKYTFLQ